MNQKWFGNNNILNTRNKDKFTKKNNRKITSIRSLIALVQSKNIGKASLMREEVLIV